MKKVWIISLFPEFFEPLKTCGIVSKAFKEKFELELVQLRDHSDNDYKGVDDSPFGGGAGMVIKADVLARSIQAILKKGMYSSKTDLHIIFPSPRGKKWNTKLAREFAQSKFIESEKDLVFICGRYEGIDERFIENYVNEFYSIGDYILSGGEIATLAILDSALRFVPEVLGNQDSLSEESFENNLLEYPVYTRPREFEGKMIPEALISGSHKRIADFKKEKSLEMTKKHRPDLLEKK